jgi:hypothetical protein
MKILEESIDYMTTRLINFNLQKNGSVTLEEAKFLNKLATEILLEAVNEMGEETPDTDKVLTDEQGNEFIYNPVTGELDPVDTPEPETTEDGLGVPPESQEEDIDQVMPAEGMIPELGEGLTESEVIANRLLSL